MTAAEEKIKVIERVLETDDALLLRKIASLLHMPSLTDYLHQPLSREAFMGRINQAEEAIQKGEITSHNDVKKLISTPTLLPKI